jgi:hypothetical protein
MLAVNSNRRKLQRNAVYTIHIVFLRSLRRLLFTAYVVLSSLIPVTLMMEALRSSQTSDLTRPTRRNISQDDTFLSHRRENLKGYILTLFVFVLVSL